MNAKIYLQNIDKNIETECNFKDIDKALEKGDTIIYLQCKKDCIENVAKFETVLEKYLDQFSIEENNIHYKIVIKTTEYSNASGVDSTIYDKCKLSLRVVEK